MKKTQKMHTNAGYINTMKIIFFPACICYKMAVVFHFKLVNCSNIFPPKILMWICPYSSYNDNHDTKGNFLDGNHSNTEVVNKCYEINEL